MNTAAVGKFRAQYMLGIRYCIKRSKGLVIIVYRVILYGKAYETAVVFRRAGHTAILARHLKYDVIIGERLGRALAVQCV